MLKADLMAQDTKVDIDFLNNDKYKELFCENQESIEKLMLEILGWRNNKQVAQKDKKRSKLCIFYTKDDVAELLGISDAQSYRIIQKLNEELRKKGYVTVAGRISKIYFHEKYYGLDKMVGEDTKGEW